MAEPSSKKAKTEVVADFGVFGMGTMGQNLALNISERGYRLAAYNRPDEFQARIWGALERAKEEGAARGKTILIDAHTELADFVASLKTPRRILLSIPSGKPVDMTLEALKPLLSAGFIFSHPAYPPHTPLPIPQRKPKAVNLALNPQTKLW